MAIINIVADLHNFDSLKKILATFDNIFCLGDIGAVMEINEFLANRERYGNSWKAFSRADLGSILDKDKKWFEQINIVAWKKQIDSLKEAGKSFTLVRGNCDYSMLSFHEECKAHLELNLKSMKLDYIQVPQIKVIDNIQLILLPYQNEPYNLGDILNKIDKSKKLFILTHCPAMKESKKKYYIYCYSAAKQISEAHSGEIYYLHGHIHPANSYIYKREGLDNITFIAPKSEENESGISLNQHVLQIDTLIGEFSLIDSVSGQIVYLKPLPEEYFSSESHWNKYDY